MPHADAAAAPVSAPAFGALLRRWRNGHGLSQLALAARADTSARHLSFMETGRALPSREMVLRLAERLGIPLRERNTWLTAAGYAPMYRQRSLDDPALATAREAVERVLAAHEPSPALALDRHWHIVAVNRAVPALLDGLDAAMLRPPVNVLRLSLHPQGLAPLIVNLGQWRSHLLHRLQLQIEHAGDAELIGLRDELLAYPAPVDDAGPQLDGEHAGLVVPLQLRTKAGVLGFISTTTVFGTALEVTVQELAIETLFPADASTAEALRALAAAWA